MAIHYLNSTKQKVADGESQNKVNHYLSEAWAFIYGIQFCQDADMTTAEVMGILTDGIVTPNGTYPAINDNFEGFSQSTMSINAVIDMIVAATEITAAQASDL